MKLFSTILFFSLMTTFLFASNELWTTGINDQNGENINKVDKKGRKQGKWVFLGKDQPEKGFPDEGKISEGPFKNDRKHGRWIMYYNDGKTPKLEGDYLNNRPNGVFIKYFPNGEIRTQGHFNSRFYTDSLKRYNENGILIYSGKFNEEGKESGTVKYFYDNGKPEFVFEANNGIPAGKATRYWPNGDIKEQITYNEDGSVKETTGEIKPVNPVVVVEKVGEKKNVKLPPKPKNVDGSFNPNSYNKVYNDDLELWMDGEFKNGHLYDGRLYIYDSDGLLLKVEIYKDGKYHSDGQI